MEPEHVSPAEEPIDPTPAAAHDAPPAEDLEPTADVDAVAEVDASDAADAAEDEVDEVDGPSVDELEGRLGDVEQAMAQIQSGQLDEAEASIASLDQRIGSASD